jgi:4-oxalomesaconate tautomerase
MRGGTSKGLYFLSSDLPEDVITRDAVLRRAMGSPDTRQIDGLGGAHPLTSKVAIVAPSTLSDADVDYLFLQVVVETGEISTSQNCGNILTGVGPFAIEHGLVDADDDYTDVRIHMVNSGSIAVARILTPRGIVQYDGDACIDGVPGSAAPVMLTFEGIEGSSCGALLPTGSISDSVDGIEMTAIDNGMPVVILRAEDFGKTGYESPIELEADSELKQRIEHIRLKLGSAMNLGNVSDKTVPKMSLVAPAQVGGTICTRTFIPHRVHEAVGVLGAVSVACACVIPGSIAFDVAGGYLTTGVSNVEVEHPTGSFIIELDIEREGDVTKIKRSSLLRTTRKLMDGNVFIPDDVWSRV